MEQTFTLLVFGMLRPYAWTVPINLTHLLDLLSIHVLPLKVRENEMEFVR